MSFAETIWSHKSDKNLRFRKSEKIEMCHEFDSENPIKALKYLLESNKNDS